MNNENIIKAKRLTDGTIVQELADGSTKPFDDTVDWDRLRSMTDDEVTVAAIADPDARPMHLRV